MAVSAVDKTWQLYREQWAPVASATSKTEAFRALPPHYEPWLRQTFPTYFQNAQGQPVPFAERHHELWRWVWALRAGQMAPSFIAPWPRGGGKSVNAELTGASCGYFGLRRYGLYISDTQRQADDHVQNMAGMFETLRVERAVNQFGLSKGWRINRLRTADGFTMDAIGMDGAIRGARIDTARPDLIILDDLDNETDTPATIEKKILTLTRKILPSGASSLTVLGVQNIPNDGIFARLVDGRAEFLLDRVIAGPYPALAGIDGTQWWARELGPSGTPRLRITQGTPTWAGQGLAECEALLTLIGVSAFLVECQHQRSALGGLIFKREWFRRRVNDYPRTARMVRFWDLAATEAKPGKDPDWTAGAKLCEARGQYTLCDMKRIRGTPLTVEDFIRQTAELDGKDVEIYLEQEPGSSGVNTIDHYQRVVLKGFAVHGVRSTGSKATRAKPAASAAEANNIALLDGLWHEDFLLECDGQTGHDDQIDAVSGAFTALHEPEPARAGTWGR